MEYTVLRPFTWAGQELNRGDKVEIPDESPKIYGLTKAKFIGYRAPPTAELPKVEEVAQEMEAEEQPKANVVNTEVASSATRDPKEIIRRAKAKAAKR